MSSEILFSEVGVEIADFSFLPLREVLLFAALKRRVETDERGGVNIIDSFCILVLFELDEAEVDDFSDMLSEGFMLFFDLLMTGVTGGLLFDNNTDEDEVLVVAVVDILFLVIGDDIGLEDIESRLLMDELFSKEGRGLLLTPLDDFDSKRSRSA